MVTFACQFEDLGGAPQKILAGAVAHTGSTLGTPLALYPAEVFPILMPCPPFGPSLDPQRYPDPFGDPRGESRKGKRQGVRVMFN